MAAEALAIERGVATEQIAAAEGLALHAAAFNGTPDPVLHLAARAMGVVTGLPALEPDLRPPTPTCSWTPPCRPPPACSSSWPSGMTAPPSPPRRSRPGATAGLTSAAAELGKATEALHGLIELAEMTGRSGRTGKTDLNHGGDR